MSWVVDGKRYDTDKATQIASDYYWDGNNWERHGRNTFLYRTPRGRYFVVTLTMWQGEQDGLRPVTEQEARDLYEGALSEHMVEYEAAFPTAAVEPA